MKRLNELINESIKVSIGFDKWGTKIWRPQGEKHISGESLDFYLNEKDNSFSVYGTLKISMECLGVKFNPNRDNKCEDEENIFHKYSLSEYYPDSLEKAFPLIINELRVKMYQDPELMKEIKKTGLSPDIFGELFLTARKYASYTYKEGAYKGLSKEQSVALINLRKNIYEAVNTAIEKEVEKTFQSEMMLDATWNLKGKILDYFDKNQISGSILCDEKIISNRYSKTEEKALLVPADSKGMKNIKAIEQRICEGLIDKDKTDIISSNRLETAEYIINIAKGKLFTPAKYSDNEKHLFSNQRANSEILSIYTDSKCKCEHTVVMEGLDAILLLKPLRKEFPVDLNNFDKTFTEKQFAEVSEIRKEYLRDILLDIDQNINKNINVLSLITTDDLEKTCSRFGVHKNDVEVFLQDPTMSKVASFILNTCIGNNDGFAEIKRIQHGSVWTDDNRHDDNLKVNNILIATFAVLSHIIDPSMNVAPTALFGKFMQKDFAMFSKEGFKEHQATVQSYDLDKSIASHLKNTDDFSTISI